MVQIGDKFGHLTTIVKINDSWLCTCKCGNLKLINEKKLIYKQTRTCGCRKTFSKSSQTHGMVNTRIYKIWHDMKNRCLNKNDKFYKCYGGRGITVCEKWLKFEGFYEDMKKGYKDNLTIDRIDVNKNYEKSNCKWSTRTEQGRNKRNNKRFDYKGKKLLISEILELENPYNLYVRLITIRVSRGMPIDVAINTPLLRHRRV